ncbi:unnamed protein product [Rotaria sp. Silwood1]|nr:unnamed protein product [Rotaria sp. Silwood1]
MIKPFEYDQKHPDRDPEPINGHGTYIDKWDEDHVHMPCSPSSLTVDFANEYIGGGVMGDGCVQEEIRFTVCPEMLTSLLVCEVMKDDECIFLIGCERYCSYKGYGFGFRFNNDYIDNTPRDSWGCRMCHVVAIDAICFSDRRSQFSMETTERELIKAYTGFQTLNIPAEQPRVGVATGNWGCGAFNGDVELKAIIQLMAASEAQRPLVYVTYREQALAQLFSSVWDHLIDHQATVGHLMQLLEMYIKREFYTRMGLFEFIMAETSAQHILKSGL